MKTKFAKRNAKEGKESHKQRVTSLRDELAKNDRILKDNTENPDRQIQVALHQANMLFQGAPMYTKLARQIEMQRDELKLKMDTGFETKYPQFSFQENPEWKKIQMERALTEYDNNVSSLKELNDAVEKMKVQLNEQNDRITARRSQIIDELNKMGENISDLDPRVE